MELELQVIRRINTCMCICRKCGYDRSFCFWLIEWKCKFKWQNPIKWPGEPLGAFVAAYIGIEIGRIFIGRTKLDIILTPLTTIVCGGIVGLTVGPYISDLMKQIGEMIRWGTEQQPFLMGIVVSVLMGMR